MTSESTAGWDAITNACVAIYGEQEPQHFGTVIKWMLGGPDPLDGISVYASERDVPHWHFVSYGMSELYAKETDDPEWSGWGFELTFRLARGRDERQPPPWALAFLQNLARYVVQSGNVFMPSHHMHLQGPIALEEQTEVHAVLFAEDPELGAIETRHGKVQFVQVVGVSDPDYDAAIAWNTLGVLDVFAQTSPLLVTDLARRPLGGDPSRAAEIERGLATEGSATSVLYVDTLALSDDRGVTTLTIGASTAERIGKLVRGRLGHGRSLDLVGGTPRTQVALRHGEHGGVNGAVISLTRAQADRIGASLRPRRGVLAWPEVPFLRVDVRPSEIRNPDGGVIRVVG